MLARNVRLGEQRRPSSSNARDGPAASTAHRCIASVPGDCGHRHHCTARRHHRQTALGTAARHLHERLTSDLLQRPVALVPTHRAYCCRERTTACCGKCPLLSDRKCRRRTAPVVIPARTAACEERCEGAACAPLERCIVCVHLHRACHCCQHGARRQELGRLRLLLPKCRQHPARGALVADAHRVGLHSLHDKRKPLRN